MAERKSKTAAAPKETGQGQEPAAVTGEVTGDATADAAPAEAADTQAATAEATSTRTEAAPLEAPEPRTRQLGDPHTSTNFVAANAAIRSVPGANHLRLHGADGSTLDPEELFEFPPAESPSTLATVRQQVLQEFTYPGASTPCSQLLYPAGARVSVEQAVRVRDALRLQAQEPDPEPRTSV